MLEAEVPVIFGTNVPSLVLQGIRTLQDPRQTERRQAALYVTSLLGIAPWAARVVDAQTAAVLRRNLAQRHADGRMKLALMVDALACGKGRVQVGVALELDFRTAHSDSLR